MRQAPVNTLEPVWNPDQPQALDFFKGWAEAPGKTAFDNGLIVQWEQFLRHVAEDGPWFHMMEEGAKRIQPVELGSRIWKERRWFDVPALDL